MFAISNYNEEFAFEVRYDAERRKLTGGFYPGIEYYVDDYSYDMYEQWLTV